MESHESAGLHGNSQPKRCSGASDEGCSTFRDEDTRQTPVSRTQHDQDNARPMVGANVIARLSDLRRDDNAKGSIDGLGGQRQRAVALTIVHRHQLSI